ncbi:2-hydroxy-3-oxopropionate reductase [Diplocarpon rosae]|nr:2-hydroxy-3-oxopropionate reductase [Diplocarpon rosae]
MCGKIAFLGLGAMGFGMATNLLQKGFMVTGFDISPPTLRRFVAAGGNASSSPKDTVLDAEYIVFMVATAAQILSALFDGDQGAIHSIRQGATVALSSTGPPEHAPHGRGSSWMFADRTPRMLVEDPTVYSAVNIMVKDIGIVTAGGRSANFPLFLSSTTEQVLAFGVSAGLGLLDDASLVGVYLPQDPTAVLKLASSAATLAATDPRLLLVENIMAGVHLAAAVEAMLLGAHVGLDAKNLFAIISTAAGSSTMFVEGMSQPRSGERKEGLSVEDVVAQLVSSSSLRL